METNKNSNENQILIPEYLKNKEMLSFIDDLLNENELQKMTEGVFDLLFSLTDENTASPLQQNQHTLLYLLYKIFQVRKTQIKDQVQTEIIGLQKKLIKYQDKEINEFAN